MNLSFFQTRFWTDLLPVRQQWRKTIYCTSSGNLRYWQSNSSQRRNDHWHNQGEMSWRSSSSSGNLRCQEAFCAWRWNANRRAVAGTITGTITRIFKKREERLDKRERVAKKRRCLSYIVAGKAVTEDDTIRMIENYMYYLETAPKKAKTSTPKSAPRKLLGNHQPNLVHREQQRDGTSCQKMFQPMMTLKRVRSAVCVPPTDPQNSVRLSISLYGVNACTCMTTVATGLA